MIKKYIKTTPVEAIQVTKNNHDEVKKFTTGDNVGFGVPHEIETLEGTMYFNDGDYLIKNATGECYVCQKEIFEKTYREVEE